MYKIVITDHFKKQLKRLVKKDLNLKQDLKESLINFDKRQSVSIGASVYKIRIAGQQKGKSGAYRAYLLAMEVDGILAPICIYAKNKQENLSYEEITQHLQKTKEELLKPL